jgi:predicted RNase H-like HicB family nuclease
LSSLKREGRGIPDYKFTVIVECEEDELYVASVPFLQGCYTQGATYEEALENIKDAIKLHIEARRALGEPVPIEVAIDEVQVVT